MACSRMNFTTRLVFSKVSGHPIGPIYIGQAKDGFTLEDGKGNLHRNVGD